MDWHGLPVVRRRASAALMAAHLLQASLVASLMWALSLTGMVLIRQGGEVARGVAYLVIVAALMAAEVGVAAWIVMRRRRMSWLAAEARRALAAGDAARSRHVLVPLLDFLEYRLNPSSVYYGLALADLLDGERQRALALLRKAGNHASSLELRALLMLEDGLAGRALRMLPLVLALRPRSQRLWIMMAACHQSTGDDAKAREILDAALARQPRSALLRNARERFEKGESLAARLLNLALPANHNGDKGSAL